MRLVEIGRFGAPYALQGGLKFRGEPVVLHLERVYVEGHGWRAVEDLYPVGDELVVHLAGVSTRELAEALVGLRVYAQVEDLPPLEEGQYYYFALMGLPVYVEGRQVGEVVDILDAGAQDVLVVRGVGERLRDQAERLIPLQAPYVRVEEEGIHVEPIPGLFD
ncbi:Ribosome maturation factor rimM [Thermus sp. CCB_US3_UF1]|uniref:ribosome maturation factor RimM n=1 Tax=Thermus sp. CCB_US3_UF1 TaxID=1111069 RepID=UPI0002389F69|nr:ribosome maturation factor RimM [Thermus sp. CCB_US3_UF1]AEV16141.1 Ribosome maturation factor rimM [Thermus sp. CCB_US3_UF1]